MAFYIKVTREVADKLGVAGIRNSTADGNVLLWQADVAGFPGDTVFDRAAVVGGVCLSPQQAKGEIDGVEYPVEVTTPPEYMDLPTEEEPKDESLEKESSSLHRWEHVERLLWIIPSTMRWKPDLTK